MEMKFRTSMRKAGQVLGERHEVVDLGFVPAGERQMFDDASPAFRREACLRRALAVVVHRPLVEREDFVGRYSRIRMTQPPVRHARLDAAVVRAFQFDFGVIRKRALFIHGQGWCKRDARPGAVVKPVWRHLRMCHC
jgi:hypothetical protein